MISRRDFFQHTVIGGASLVALTAWPAYAGKFNLTGRIGLAMYMMRYEMDKDIDLTLQRIAEIGYDELEIAHHRFTIPPSPLGLRASLERHGLRRPCGRFAYSALVNEPYKSIETALIVGHQYIVCQGAPWDRPGEFTTDKVSEFCAEMNRIGEICRAEGLKLVVHNHDFEFNALNGKRSYDQMLAQLDPQLVNMQICIYWATVAGIDLVDLFNTHPGRFPIWHVRDMSASADKHDVDLGTGVIDFGRIFAAADKAGMKHFLVDQEPPKDPFKSIKVAYDYLKKM